MTGFQSSSRLKHYVLSTETYRMVDEHAVGHLNMTSVRPSPPNPVLCVWCEKHVFDKHTLAVINLCKSTTPPRSLLDLEGFEVHLDAAAYFANHNSSPSFKRTFRQSALSVKREADNGCIFCILLENALGRIPPSAQSAEHLDGVRARLEAPGQATSDFHFTLGLRFAWQWTNVSIVPQRGSEAVLSEGFFRVYAVDSRFLVGGVCRQVPPSLDILNPDFDKLGHDAPALTTKEPSGEYDGHWEQTLEQDGKVFRALVDDCMDNHSECTRRDISLLPSMLLQISGIITSPHVRLIKVSRLADRPVRYVCLSYCWGGTQPEMTTSSRLASYMKGIDVTTFPLTVLDAIRVTLSLKLEYLWVDAFCIVQDSGFEKDSELKKMASIYAGAVCTVSAMSSKAATEGFLNPMKGRENDATSTWNVNIQDASSDRAAVLEMRSDLSHQGIFHQHLLARAWTFQEALLSPRLIMFFSEGQRPAFRCIRGTLRSDGGIVPQIPKPLMCMEETMTKFQSEPGWRRSTNIAEEWAALVKQYSQRAMTNQEDRFPALMGIVARWEGQLGRGTFRAGLWSSTLRCDLVWRAQPTSSPRSAVDSFIAPSWSWASRAHPVYYQPREEIWDDDRLARILACDVTPVDPEAPNGAVKSARLTIQCIAEEITVPDSKYNDISARGERLQTRDGSVDFSFDDDPRPRNLKKMWLLSIAWEEPYNTSHEIGLGVTEVRNADNSATKLYRRVGMFADMKRGEKPLGPMLQFTIV